MYMVMYSSLPHFPSSMFKFNIIVVNSLPWHMIIVFSQKGKCCCSRYNFECDKGLTAECFDNTKEK